MRNVVNWDPHALSPGREYPRMMHHATKPPVMVSSAREERQLGPEWSREYIYQEYPKVKHHWSGKTATVKSADDEASLGLGWSNRVTEFDLYKDARKIRHERHDPCKWLNEWSVPGLSEDVRRKIKAQFLRADAAFERTLDSDPDSGAISSMRQAFDGIARVLYEAGILTADSLHREISQCVWEGAIAGGWYRTASETDQGIFPERLGRYWVWRDESHDWNELFRAETTEWEAKLLEDPPAEPPAASIETVKRGNKGRLQSTREAVGGEKPASTEAGQFSDTSSRLKAIEVYTNSWGCSEAALGRAARVNKADLSKWKKGQLPPTSSKKERIEIAIKENRPPIRSEKERPEL